MSTILEKLDSKTPITVLITGACGQIAYNLIYFVARGDAFGVDQPINLHLLDIPPLMDKLGAVVMELEDCASPCVNKIVATADYETAFTGVDVALLVGARPRGPGMERKDLLQANASIFKGQGEAMDKYASKDVKVLVVGNPANTNALIASHYAPSIPKANFTALTRLDQNRAVAQIAARVGAPVKGIRDVFIWGNHSTTQYPDVRFAKADGKEVSTMLDAESAAWVRSDFITTIQQRGKAVIDKRGGSSAASAANAIVDHIRDWVLGSDGRAVSMGVYSDGTTYGVTEGLIFSMPVVCSRGGSYRIVTDFAVDEFSAEKFKATEEELVQERTMALA